MSSVVSPFELTGPLKKIPAVAPLLLSVAERGLALQRLANIHRQLAGSNFASPARFAEAALEILQVRFEIDPAKLDLIPRTGPAAIVANHPYGGLEGLYLIQLLLDLRPAPADSVATALIRAEIAQLPQENVLVTSQCTAIIACNHDMAAAAISVAHRHHLRVPEDITVVGFDDTPIASIVSSAITTARQPIAAMTQSAIRMLHLAATPSAPHENKQTQKVLPCTLIERESSAPPREQPVTSASLARARPRPLELQLMILPNAVGGRHRQPRLRKPAHSRSQQSRTFLRRSSFAIDQQAARLWRLRCAAPVSRFERLLASYAGSSQ